MTPPSSAARGGSLFVVALVLLANGWTLGGGFLGDDFAYVARFAHFPLADWPRLFVADWSGGLWGDPLRELRPVAALSFMLDSAVWGPANALGYRLTNLLLHLGAVLLVLRLARLYCPAGSPAPLVAAVFFAVQPAHVETVTWVTGRVDLLSTFFALAFWVAAERYVAVARWRWLIAAFCLLAIGVFAKEAALLSPALLLGSWLVLPSPSPGAPLWKRHLPVLLAVGIVIGLYAFCRHAAFGGGATSSYSGWSNPEAWQRQAGYLGWLLPILPWQDRLQFPTPFPPSVLRFLFATGLVFSVGALLWCRLRSQRSRATCALVFFGCWWYAATVGSLLLVGYFSPRHLYFPTVGIAVAAGVLFSLVESRKPLAWGAATLVCVGFLGARIAAQKPWVEAGRTSTQLIAEARRAAPRLEPGEILIVDAPTMRRTAWLWAWASPFFATDPFVSPGFAPERVLERPDAYYRPDAWSQARRRARDALTAGSPATLVHVSRQGEVSVRRLAGEEVRRRFAPEQIESLTPEGWNRFFDELAAP